MPLLPGRKPETSKNDYGRVWASVARVRTGAPYFATQGAVRMGSGIRRRWPFP